METLWQFFQGPPYKGQNIKGPLFASGPPYNCLWTVPNFTLRFFYRWQKNIVSTMRKFC